MTDKLNSLMVDMAVRDLHVRYADAVWRKDLVEFGDCFAVDCEWRIGGKVSRGREQCVEFFADVLTHFNRILLTFRSPILQVGNGTATARTYVMFNNIPRVRDAQRFVTLLGT